MRCSPGGDPSGRSNSLLRKIKTITDSILRSICVQLDSSDKFPGTLALAGKACTDAVPGYALARRKKFAASLGSLALAGKTCTDTVPGFARARRKEFAASLGSLDSREFLR